MKHDTQRRFAYIETCLYWGNGLTAGHLGNIFDIARQNAQKVIERYRALHPDNLYYDASKKRHCITNTFIPAYINTSPERYLGYIRSVNTMTKYWDEEKWTPDIPFETDDNYLSPPQHSRIVKAILASIKEKYSIHIVYRSKFKTLSVSVAAHTLVYANHRYHVRAFRHDKGWFVDLVLTRFIEIEKAEETWVSALNDERWHTKLTLVLQINPELPEETQQALREDYRLGSGNIRTIQVRHAMLGYICREMERIDWRKKMALWIDLNGVCCSKTENNN